MNINEAFYCSRCLREMEDEGICPFCGYDAEKAAYDPQALEEGALLHGRRYRIGALIGKGGFGMTYAAWDETLLAPVAIKEYFPAGYASRNIEESYEVTVSEEDQIVFAVGLSNFNREAHILAALQNVEHVVKVSNCFEENATGYIVMEYVRGVTLTEYVCEHKPSSEALLKMLREPIDALVLIHAQGVMHRDITPNNLMVQEDGTIKLIDFGAALIDERKMKGKSYAISATRHYAAPEQYDPDMAQGQWTDVYGLSATTYALLTGSEPPDSQERMKRDTLVPPRKMGKGLSKCQERALIEGLRVDPNHRLRSVEEFRSILYNLPTPEIVRQRKKVFWQMMTVMIAAAAITLILVVNFTFGVPLGGGLRYALYPDGWHVTGGAGIQQEIDIPGTRLMLPVTQIRDRAFEGSLVRRANIDGSVKTIGSQAFYASEALESVSIGRGTREIGSLAFADCSALHTMNLPSSLEAIGEYAFLNTPEYMTLWGERDERLQALVKAAGSAYAVREDYEIAVDGESAVLTAYHGGAGEVVLPSVIDGYRVTQMDTQGLFWAFPKGTTSLVYPYFLTEVPDGELFYQPGALKRVVLGPHVWRIGEEAFADTGIETISLPQGLYEIGKKAFYFSDLTQAVIPDSVRVIGEEAFHYTALERVVIPDTVEVFGSDAFSSNDELTELIFPRTLQMDVMNDVFSNCTSLERITIPDSVKEIDMLAFWGCVSLEAVNIPEGVEEIDHGAFSDCIGMKYIGIPSSVTKIDENAFDGCSAELIIGGFPGSYAQEYAQAYGYRFEDRSLWTPGLIKEGKVDASNVQGDLVCPVFDEESNSLVKTVKNIHPKTTGKDTVPIMSIRLPLFAQEIELGAMNELPMLESIELPKTLQAIQSLSLCDNAKLKTVILPQGLRILEGSAFSGCTALEGIKLPQSLELLGSAAFFGCTALERIEIPPRLTELDYRIFSESGIRSVIIPSNIRVCQDTFSDCRQLAEATVEEGLREMNNTFKNCTALETVHLPSTLTWLGAETFKGCTALKDVYFEGMEMTCFFFADGRSKLFSPEYYFRVLEGGAKEIAHAFSDSPHVTIHARRGSVAEMYAQVFNLKFEPIEETEL